MESVKKQTLLTDPGSNLCSRPERQILIADSESEQKGQPPTHQGVSLKAQIEVTPRQIKPYGIGSHFEWKST